MAKRGEFWWCIASGKLLLPFTVRATRKQAVADFCNAHPVSRLDDFTTVVKVRVERVRRTSRRFAPSVTKREEGR